MTRPRVLMVTGVYHPETSGASLQCRQLVAGLADRVDFEVLTTSAHGALPRRDVVDGVPVRRIVVDPARPLTKLAAAPVMTTAFLEARRRVDLVHLHGFSQKNVLLMALARLTGVPIVMKLTSYGHDDALTMRQAGGWRWTWYRRAERAIAVAPRFEEAWRSAGLDPRRLVFIPNAVNLERFRPADDAERVRLRRGLGWPHADPVVLFVGFFSHEKRPDLLYRAWARLVERGLASTLVLVGVTRSAYYEVDPALADSIRADAARRGLTGRLVFVESAPDIERCYRAADVFALPTLREGLPNVLLEAMACAVPPIITRLPGVTDWIVDDGVSGRLVPPSDEDAMALALEALLTNPAARAAMGAAARARVERDFRPEQTALRTLAVYDELLGPERAA